MANEKTDSDSDSEYSYKNNYKQSSDPRLNALGNRVGISDRLKSWLSDLSFFLLSLKHGVSLGERGRFHQDGQGPSALLYGYRDNGLADQIEVLALPVEVLSHPLRHLNLL